MKKLFYVVLIGVIILLSVSFVYLNHQVVDLNYYMGLYWEGPLPVLLVATWIFGAVSGYLMSAWSSFKLRGKLFKIQRELKKVESNSCLIDSQ